MNCKKCEAEITDENRCCESGDCCNVCDSSCGSEECGCKAE